MVAAVTAAPARTAIVDFGNRRVAIQCTEPGPQEGLFLLNTYPAPIFAKIAAQAIEADWESWRGEFRHAEPLGIGANGRR